ncbi:MAG TPA: hypothetical protein HA257_06455 [Candidatus Methanoperedenaceae archaeon]|nr:hypothetical protein [Candidatus Methanoperedenaceae archaeon]
MAIFTSIKTSKLWNALTPSMVLMIVALASVLDVSVTYRDVIRYFRSPVLDFVLVGLLLVTASSVSIVRLVNDRTLKDVLYMVAGLATFAVVGAAYTPMVEGLNVEPQDMYIRFFTPVLIFALANSITVMVASIDGRKSGYIFGAMGFIVPINIVLGYGFKYVNQKPDVLLLIAVLWMLIPVLWVRTLASAIEEEFSVEKRAVRTIAASIKTVLIYLLLGLSYLVSQGGIDISFNVMKVIDTYSSIIAGFSIIAGWYYVLSHVIIMFAMFMAHELALHAFDVKREMADDGSVVYVYKEKKKDVKDEKIDPFEPIINEMKKFQKEFHTGEVNRLVATQKIAKMKSELDLMLSKYEIGSREAAVKTLASIEKEVEFVFK